MTLQALHATYAVANERQILITEVTRMSGGLVCVAGIDIATGGTVRPLMNDGSNWSEDEWVDADFHRVGNLLSFKAAAPGNPAYPHASEDFRVSHVTKLANVSRQDLHAICVEAADSDIEDIFDHQLVDGKYVVADTVCRSLGCVLVDIDALRVSGKFDKVQLSYRDEDGVWHNLTATELETKHHANSEDGAAAMRDRLDQCRGIAALRIGLARAWDGAPHQDYNPKRCFLQLNGLILPA